MWVVESINSSPWVRTSSSPTFVFFFFTLIFFFAVVVSPSPHWPLLTTWVPSSSCVRASDGCTDSHGFESHLWTHNFFLSSPLSTHSFYFNWRGTRITNQSDIFLASKCDLGFNWKTLPCNFFCCFVFRFREIMHAKMQVFLVANVRFANSVVWKNKSFVWKGHCQEKHCVFADIICGKQKRNQQTKIGDSVYVFLRNRRLHEKLNSFGWVKKKYGLESHLG